MKITHLAVYKDMTVSVCFLQKNNKGDIKNVKHATYNGKQGEMKESKAVYVTKHKIRDDQNLVYQLYRSEARDYSPERRDDKCNFSCQYDSKKDNEICTCKNVIPVRRQQDVRYFSSIPKQVYTYATSRSFTDIGVGSVKALQRRKVKRIYLPETDNRGVGSSDLSSFVFRKGRPVKTSGLTTSGSYYDHKRTSSKCVGGILEYNTGCVINEKLSPIIQTKSGATSPKISLELKNTAIGSNTVDKMETISTQFETEMEPEKQGIRPETPPVIETKIVQKVSQNTQKSKISNEVIESKKKQEIKIKSKEADTTFSSDSLVQHVHNLENPSDEKHSRTSFPDPMENKLEREYRKMFSTTKSKESKASYDRSLSEFKSASILRRRFEALRRGLGRKDESSSKKISSVVVETSKKDIVATHKDASVTSDPPSLIGRSFSNTKKYSPEIHSVQQDTSKSQYCKEAKCSAQWPQNSADSECQGVKGMFKLWGKKFNFEDDAYGKRRATPMPSYDVEKKSEKVIKGNFEAPKKERRKFFFFKKKSKDKNKEVYNPKKHVTAGRCEIRDGLVLKIGAAKTSKDKIPKITEETSEITRTEWLKKFLSSTIESVRSVNVRWLNNMYATSSSTVFELLDTVYKNTGVVFRSTSQSTTGDSSFYKSYTKHKVNFAQDIEAWMIPKTFIDKPVKQIPVKIYSNNNMKEKDIEGTISDQKWCIEKSEACSRKIEIVLHSNNYSLANNSKVSSEYLRIDIPKDFFDTTSSDESKQNPWSDEKVFKIVEYETKSETKRERKKKDMRDLVKGDHVPNDIKVTVSIKDSTNTESKILETVIKSPPTHRDVVIQGSNVNIPKRCDVIGVGIITQGDLKITKPILKIQDYLTDEDSEPELQSNQKKCEFAESYLQEYYRNQSQWCPLLGMDVYSWRASDSQVRSCSEKSSSSFLNQGDGSKSCPNVYEDFQAASNMNSCESAYSHCNYNEQCVKMAENITDKFFNKFKKNPTKAKTEIDVTEKRVLPKDSLEVFKRRKIYAASNKSQWADNAQANCKPVSVPSIESKGTPNSVLIECPRMERPIHLPPKKKSCKKHVSLPDCETMNYTLGKQFSDKIEGILSFKGAACDACKKKGSKCPKHRVAHTQPQCVIPQPPCKESCEMKKDPACNQPNSPSCNVGQTSSSPPGSPICVKSPMPSCITCLPPRCYPPPDPSVPPPCPASLPACDPQECTPTKPNGPPPCQDIISPPSSICSKLSNMFKKSSSSSSSKKRSPRKKSSPSKKPSPCKKSSSSKKPSSPCKKSSSTKKKRSPCSRSSPCKKLSPSKKPSPCKKTSPCRKPSPCTPPSPCRKSLPCPKPSPCKKKSPCRKPSPCKKSCPSNERLPRSKQPCKKNWYHSPPCKKKPEECCYSSSSCNLSGSEVKIVSPKTSQNSQRSGMSLTKKACPSPKISPIKKPNPCLKKTLPDDSKSTCGSITSQVSSTAQSPCGSNTNMRPSSEPLKYVRPPPLSERPCPPQNFQAGSRTGLDLKQSPTGEAKLPKILPCQSSGDKLADKSGSSCDQTSQEFPWPCKNQVSNQPSLTCPPAEPNKTCQSKKNSSMDQAVGSYAQKPACPSKAIGSSTWRQRLGLSLKMRPSKKKPCPSLDDPELMDGVIKLCSTERISIKIKQETPSTEEIRKMREPLNIRVQDEDGQTLYERRDYNRGNQCHPVLGGMYRDSKINRVSTPVTVTNMSEDEDNKEITAFKSDQSLVNLVEIKLKLRITQGDKTTEVNIGNEKEDDQNKNVSIAKSTPDVFVVKDEVKDITEDDNPKNDINIKITVRNFKPKHKNADEKENAEDFSKNISDKFHTVSTGYSDVEVDPNEDHVFSVHRATMNVSSSVVKSETFSNISNEIQSKDFTDYEPNLTSHSTELPTDGTEDEKDEGKLLSGKKDSQSEKCDEINVIGSELPDFNDTDDQDAANLGLSTSNECNVESKTSKLASKENKKALLKKVMQKAVKAKSKNKESIRGLRDMLKIILTDSSDNDDVKVTSNELLKDVTYTSLKPNYFRDTDSMNNYYQLDSTLPSIKDSNIKPIYTTEGNSYISKDSDRCENDFTFNGCMCSKIAAKLNEPNMNLSCCCRRKLRRDEETNCDLRTDDDILLLNYRAAEHVDVETQNSKYFSNINSLTVSIHSKNKSLAQIAEKIRAIETVEIVKNPKTEKDNLTKTVITNSYVREMKSLNHSTVHNVAEDSKVIITSGKGSKVTTEMMSSKVKSRRHSQGLNILQSNAAKKAVLEIYAEKSEDGEHFVAKLPKFAHERESEIARNYEQIATNYYKTVRTQNIVMMSVKR